MLNRYVEQGVKGFGEHKPGVPIDDAGSMELYAVCGELKLPVLFHLDEQRNTDEAGLPGLEKVLKAHPETTFIGHGPGWWASISGDMTTPDLGKYPTGPVAPGGAIDRLMDAYPNLYGELSADSGAGALEPRREVRTRFMSRRRPIDVRRRTTSRPARRCRSSTCSKSSTCRRTFRQRFSGRTRGACCGWRHERTRLASMPHHAGS